MNDSRAFTAMKRHEKGKQVLSRRPLSTPADVQKTEEQAKARDEWFRGEVQKAEERKAELKERGYQLYLRSVEKEIRYTAVLRKVAEEHLQKLKNDVPDGRWAEYADQAARNSAVERLHSIPAKIEESREIAEKAEQELETRWLTWYGQWTRRSASEAANAKIVRLESASRVTEKAIPILQKRVDWHEDFRVRLGAEISETRALMRILDGLDDDVFAILKMRSYYDYRTEVQGEQDPNQSISDEIDAFKKYKMEVARESYFARQTEELGPSASATGVTAQPHWTWEHMETSG